MYLLRDVPCEGRIAGIVLVIDMELSEAGVKSLEHFGVWRWLRKNSGRNDDGLNLS